MAKNSSNTYETVAVGGTFDYLHKGHKALLSKAFEVSENVLIGITSDSFVRQLGKTLRNAYAIRATRVEYFVKERFPGKSYTIITLYDYFGKGIFAESMEALVASEETVGRVELVNSIREIKGLKALETVVVETVLADDGKPMSSTRIRKGEIDEEGYLLKPFK